MLVLVEKVKDFFPFFFGSGRLYHWSTTTWLQRGVLGDFGECYSDIEKLAFRNGYSPFYTFVSVASLLVYFGLFGKMEWGRATGFCFFFANRLGGMMMDERCARMARCAERDEAESVR